MASPLKNPKVSQPWGRPNPRYSAKRHTGIDFACPVGTPLFAVAAGTIKDVLNDKSYGRVVVLTCKSDKGTVDIWYCHMSKPTVKKGQKVAEGEELGLSGNTGNSTGPHLHLETRVSPFRYGNDVSNPFLDIPGIIDKNAPSERKIGLWKKGVAIVTPAKKPANKIVRMANLAYGSTNDDIKVVQSALIDLCGAKIPVNGIFDEKTREAYKLWQHKLGFHGKDADGVPGKKSMSELAKKYGFKLV
jgi:murein DD-endopeptidase MepM/ murein hydrolase activator NlpD